MNLPNLIQNNTKLDIQYRHVLIFRHLEPVC